MEEDKSPFHRIVTKDESPFQMTDRAKGKTAESAEQPPETTQVSSVPQSQDVPITHKVGNSMKVELHYEEVPTDDTKPQIPQVPAAAAYP